MSHVVTTHDNKQIAVIKFDKPFYVCGDVLIKFHHQGTITNTSMFRIAFSTYFIDETNKLSFNKQEVGPDKIKKSNQYDPNFL